MVSFRDTGGVAGKSNNDVFREAAERSGESFESYTGQTARFKPAAGYEQVPQQYTPGRTTNIQTQTMVRPIGSTFTFSNTGGAFANAGQPSTDTAPGARGAQGGGPG